MIKLFKYGHVLVLLILCLEFWNLLFVIEISM